MYTVPPTPDNAISKFSASDCSSGAAVLDSAMGMGGTIDGLLVCSSCRKPMVVHLIRREWVHA